MNTALREIFDSCGWSGKHMDALPESLDDARYLWREEEAPLAKLFFSSGVLKEETSDGERLLFGEVVPVGFGRRGSNKVFGTLVSDHFS